MKHAIAVLTAAILIGGCASVPVEKRFDGLRADIEERTGHEITWSGVTQDEEAVAEAVEAMLADELTAEEAVHISLLYNRDLQARYADFGIALADLTQAGLPPNPVAEIIVRFQEDSAFDLRTWEIVVVQDFLDILLIPLRKNVAKTEFERVKMDVTRDVIGHATDTRIAFYRLQSAQQTLEMLGQVLLSAEASLEMAMRLFAAGNVAEVELLAERSRYEDTKLTVADAERMVAEKREVLNRRMGLWGSATLWDATVRLPELPEEEINLESLEQRVVEASLDLDIAWRDIETTARRNRIKTIETVVPELSIGGEFERETEVETELHENAFGEQELRSSEGPDLWWRGPSLAVPVPIFDQGQAARTRGQMAVRQAWDQFTALAVDLRSKARDARYRLQYARDVASNYRDVMLPLQERLRLQTHLRYNAMFVGVFDLLDMKRQEIETARRYIRALQDYWIARAEIEQMLLGRMTPGGGEENENMGTTGAPLGGDERGHQ